MTHPIKIIIGGVGLAVLLAIVSWLSFGSAVFSGFITTESTTQIESYRNYDFFASSTAPTVIATTTSATSTGIVYFDSLGRRDDGSLNIAGAKNVTFFFSRADNGQGNTGSSTFSVQVTRNGIDWFNFNKLISNVTNANSEELTRVASVEIETSTSTVMVGMDLLHDAFLAVRCIVVETIDGEHSCSAFVEY